MRQRRPFRSVQPDAVRREETAMSTDRRRTTTAHAWALAALVGALCALVLGTASVQAAPPANDAVATAEAIDGENGLRTATNAEATTQPEEPNHGGGRSVWYRWTAPATAPFAFATCNTGGAPATTFDTIVAVYTGPSTALQRVARNDDACGEQSQAVFGAVAGTTYHVVVAGYEGASGVFTLRWRRIVAPPNDHFGAAQALTGATGTVTGTTLGASLEAGEPSHGQGANGSVWYSWTSTATAPVTFETCGSGFDTLLAVYTGAALAQLTQVVQNDDGCSVQSRVRLNAQAGAAYRIAVAGFEEQGELTLKWLHPPANDDRARATTLTGARGTHSGSSVGATREANDPAPLRGAPVWFRWRAPSSASVAFSTCTASFDTVLAVYLDRPAGLRIAASSDDACASGDGSLVVLHPRPGATYAIAVDGIRAATGTFTLVWGGPPPYAWCRVPDVRGEKLNDAREAIREANCAVGRVLRAHSALVPRGVVLAQRPAASFTRRPFGTPVDIEVSTGPE
jgi:hypothetical protein